LPFGHIGNVSLRILLNEKDTSFESFWIQVVKPFKVSYVFPSVVRTKSAISITVYGENFAEPLNLLLGHYSIDCAIRSTSVAVCERSALISMSQGELFAELVSAFHSENISTLSVASNFEN
jgi:hypothetical protein